MKIDLQQLHSISSEHGVSAQELESMAPKIGELLDKFKQRNQGFYQLVDDLEMVQKVKNTANELTGKFKSIVILGIGGSALGTICLQQSLGHLFQHSNPDLIVLDNIDPDLLGEVQDRINLAETLFIVVTKSGGTPETLAQYFYFRKLLENQALSVQDHMVFITDPEQGFLRKTAQNEQITTLEVPTNVGGRFSVLTAVGLLPAALIGLNIDELMAGAREMRDRFLSTNLASNLPYQMAVIQYLLYQKGKTINVLMPYSQKLIKFADWYRQLLAESIGKAQDIHGNIVNVGITPVNALGATDQHSQSQLYNEGPNDKFFIFLNAANFSHDPQIPEDYLNEPALEFLKNCSFKKLFHTEKLGTEMALTKNRRPNLTIELDKVDAFSLGQLLMLFEGATAFLGELMEIDAFDQPGVELSKNITKELLQADLKS